MRPGRRAHGCRGGPVARLIAALPLLLALLLPRAPAAAQEPGPRVLDGDSLRIVYWPGYAALAERARRDASAPLPLPGIPDSVRTALRGTLFLAPTPAVFDSLTRGRAPAWAGGVAIPALRVIVLPTYLPPGSPLGDPIVALRHEIAHLTLNAYLPGPIPRWFDEGYATWVSGGFDQSSAWQIRLAFLLGRAPRLDSLALHWPRGAARARLAYLLSATAVQHLATRSGEPGFAALLRAWRERGGLDSAIRATYQMTLGQFEQEWRAVVRRRYGWMLALSQIGAFWLAVVLLVLFVGTRRRRDNRARLARMEEEERMLPPPDPLEEPADPTGPTDPGEPPGLDGDSRAG